MLALSISAAAIYFIAIHQDLTRRRIPNLLSIGLLIIGLAKWAMFGHWQSIIFAVLSGLSIFFLTAFFNWRGWIGGGDVKLISSSCFLFGLVDSIRFIFWTTLIGGGVSLIVLAHTLIARYGRRQRVGVGSGAGGMSEPIPVPVTVPYGVAISAAALFVLFYQSQ